VYSDRLGGTVREIVPSAVLRVLSLHGPLQLVAGPPGSEASIRAECAPYEDVIFTFVSPRGELLKKTFQNCSAQIHAKDPAGAYAIFMRGRAVAGPNVMAHPRRTDLMAWVPEGANPRALTVVSFLCEEIEYRYQEGDSERIFSGKTPLGSEAPPVGVRWSRGAFGGMLVLNTLSVLGIWAYLLFQGHDYPYRFIALVVATAAILMLQAGARLWYRGTAFLRYLEGRAYPEEAGELLEGLLAPAPCRQLSGILSALGLALCGVLILWPGPLAQATLGLSFAWVLWPLWVLHFSQSQVEPRDTKRRAG
jgi:hypothetical protein